MNEHFISIDEYFISICTYLVPNEILISPKKSKYL